MITIEQAKAMFDEMIKNSKKKYFFDQISEIAFEAVTFARATSFPFK